MATAKKTSSGRWKVRVFSHTDETGKHYRAFTANTKQEAEAMAAAFSGTADRAARCDLTVKEAVKGYIDAKEAVLSPATVYAYRVMLENCFGEIATHRITRLTTEQVQLFVSNLAKEKSPKYVRNIYALFSSSVALYAPQIHFVITLPRKEKKRRYAPKDSDIQALIDKAEPWLKLCIALAAFGSLRRGEIAALRFRDLSGNILSVHADVVRGNNGSWVRKEIPKTEESNRLVPLPDAIVKMIGTGEPGAPMIPEITTPNRVTDHFMKLRDELNLAIRFHDLRHYYVSISAALGIPQSYTERAGGYRPNSPVMRDVYQNPIIDYEERYAKELLTHFSGVISAPSENV